MVKNEDQKVGPRGQVASFLLAGGTGFADFGKPGCVGEEEAALDAVELIRVVLGLLGRAHDGFALAGFPTEERAHERSLAGRAGSEDDHVKFASMRGRREFRKAR